MVIYAVIAILISIGGALFLIAISKAAYVVETIDVYEDIEQETARSIAECIDLKIQQRGELFNYADAVEVLVTIKDEYGL